MGTYARKVQSNTVEAMQFKGDVVAMAKRKIARKKK